MNLALGILGIIMVLAFMAWTIVLFAFRPKYFFILWLGVPALGLGILIVLAEAVSVYHSWPTVAFRESLGFAPPPDVTIINSLRHFPIDWDDTYLEFYASDVTIRRILQYGFAPIRADEISEYGTAPDWWNPPIGPKTRIYATNTGDPEFHNKDFRFFVSQKLLIFDPDSGNSEKRKVYFRYRRH